VGQVFADAGLSVSTLRDPADVIALERLLMSSDLNAPE